MVGDGRPEVPKVIENDIIGLDSEVKTVLISNESVWLRFLSI